MPASSLLCGTDRHVVHEDAEIKGPTRASMPGSEMARGPLILQGDHGRVASRNIRLRELPQGRRYVLMSPR